MIVESHPGMCRDVALEVLRCFPVDPAEFHLERPPDGQGFSGAIVLRLTPRDSGAQPVANDRRPFVYCLRGWPEHSLPRPRIAELHRFLQFVDHEGPHVLPVPMASLHGDTLVLHAGRFWQLEPWMPGVADFHRYPSDSRLRSAMHALAQLHRTAARYVPTSAGREWFSARPAASSPGVHERLSLFRTWTEQRLQQAARSLAFEANADFARVAWEFLQLFRRHRAPLQAELHAAAPLAVPVQVCLRDIWHDHLLFTGDELTGLVDPSAARTESVAADLSRLLGSLLGEWNERWEAALSLYQQVRPLSAAERQLVRALHHSGTLLSGMAWIDRQMNGPIPRDLLPRVTDRLAGLRNQVAD